MNMNESIQRAFYTVKGFVVKHAPTILAAAGVGTLITAGVVATIKAPKVQKVIEENNKAIEDAKECIGLPVEHKNGEIYTADDYLQFVKSAKAANVLTYIKAYAPPVSMAVAGAAMIFGGNHINNKRVANATAACAAAISMLDKYRKNVVERFGEKVDADLRIGRNPDKVDENGEKKEEPVNDYAKRVFSNPYSDYGRIFDETNKNFKRQPTYNKFFLDSCERQANDKLRIRGYLFLNEVYEMLDFEPTEAGQIVGWVYDSARGDGYISFGHNNKNYESSCQFLAGLCPEVILDFNVDGPITDHFKKI